MMGAFRSCGEFTGAWHVPVLSASARFVNAVPRQNSDHGLRMPAARKLCRRRQVYTALMPGFSWTTTVTTGAAWRSWGWRSVAG